MSFHTKFFPKCYHIFSFKRWTNTQVKKFAFSNFISVITGFLQCLGPLFMKNPLSDSPYTCILFNQNVCKWSVIGLLNKSFETFVKALLINHLLRSLPMFVWGLRMSVTLILFKKWVNQNNYIFMLWTNLFFVWGNALFVNPWKREVV